MPFSSARKTNRNGKTRIKKMPPADPSDKSHLYKTPGEHGDCDLYSFGRDGKQGCNDDDADVANW